MFKNSESVFNVSTKCSNYKEKQLMIDINLVRKAYDLKNISKLVL